ncbi:MAG: hypothetical protein J0G97_07070, partial [Rhizobium pusense]|nr:hypothetical protein [Agrobacterium pusense]
MVPAFGELCSFFVLEGSPSTGFSFSQRMIESDAGRSCFSWLSPALHAAGLQGSMSAIGTAYHNAQAESFTKTLKVEDVYIAGHDTFADVTEFLLKFIEGIDNAKWLHAALGFRSPEFETQLAQLAAWYEVVPGVSPRG